MSIFTNLSWLGGLTDAQQSLSIKKGCYVCQLLDNVDMHMYVKFDQIILCGLGVISILTIF